MEKTKESKAISIAHELRQNGISVETDYLNRKIKAQFKSADRLNAKAVIVIGDEELEKQSAVLKDLTTGNQQLVPFSSLISEVQKLSEE